MAYTTRQQLIDRILRFYYDGVPDDSATITPNEVDLYINDAIDNGVPDFRIQQAEGLIGPQLGDMGLKFK